MRINKSKHEHALEKSNMWKNLNQLLIFPKNRYKTIDCINIDGHEVNNPFEMTYSFRKK